MFFIAAASIYPFLFLLSGFIIHWERINHFIVLQLPVRDLISQLSDRTRLSLWAPAECIHYSDLWWIRCFIYLTLLFSQDGLSRAKPGRIPPQTQRGSNHLLPQPVKPSKSFQSDNPNHWATLVNHSRWKKWSKHEGWAHQQHCCKMLFTEDHLTQTGRVQKVVIKNVLKLSYWFANIGKT